MIDYLYFLLLGVGAGAIIAAFGLGLLITHQGSGVVNFALGATSAWAAYVYADLRRGAYTLPFPGFPARYHFAGGDVGFRWAMVLALLTAVVLGIAEYVLVFRPLFRAPALAKVVASIGLVIVLISLIERRFAESSGVRVGAILPREPVTIADGLTVPRDGLWLAAIVIAIGAAVWVASRYTRIGLVTRAAAENEKGAVLLGYSPTFLAGASFVLASLIGAFVVILASPMIQLSSSVFTFGFLVPALGAALIGKFRQVWPTVITGMAIGMVQSTFTKMQSDISWFPEYGARQGVPFLVIIVAMVVLGERLPERGSVDTWKLPAVPPAKITALSVLVPVVLAVGGLFVLGPLWRGAIMTSTIAFVLALSLVVLTGFGGQTSLAQMAFAGVAGFALSKIAMQWGVPFPIAPILAALVATVFGVLVGVPRAAGARDQLGDHHPCRGSGHHRVRVQEPEVRRRSVDRRCQGAQPEARWLGPRADPGRSGVTSHLRCPARGRRRAARTRRRQHPQQCLRATDARGEVERTSGERRRDQCGAGEAAGVRRIVVHRGHRRLPHRLSVRQRVRRIVRDDRIAHRAGRRLPGRHHLRQRRGGVGHHGGIGCRVLRDGPDHRQPRPMGVVDRRGAADPHRGAQPRRHRRRHPLEGACRTGGCDPVEVGRTSSRRRDDSKQTGARRRRRGAVQPVPSGRT